MNNLFFKKRTMINQPVEEVFKWHSRPGAIERLCPPWDPFKLISMKGGIDSGAEVILQMKAGPIPFRWHAKHTEYEENRFFTDIQIKGPFPKWTHRHRFEQAGDQSCIIEDEIEFRSPFHPVGTFLSERFIRKKLERIFSYRHRITAKDIAVHLSRRDTRPMRILVSGGSGLIGSALIPFLTTGGHHVIRLVRRSPDNEKGEVFWDPASEVIDKDGIQNIDAVIHLSGENIGEGKWTEDKKRAIIESRNKSTSLIARTIASMKSPPKIMISASAIGFYGNRGDKLLTESDSKGDDFISEVCDQWEKSTEPAKKKGIRTAMMRIGIVLSPRGGALSRLLLPFKAGLGAKIASGYQYMSWVGLDDVIYSIYHTLFDETIEGPVNVVSPNPVRNLEFTKTLGKVLSRQAFFKIPAPLIKMAFGKMGEELLLSSTRVKPEKLQKTGYIFFSPDLEMALRHVLGT